MNATAELAGYMAAHALWSVFEGATLIPMLAFEKDDGFRHIFRFADEDLPEGVDRGHEWLAKNPVKAARAVFVYDTYVTLPAGKFDALLVEAHQLHPDARSVTLAIPYRHASSVAGFAVHRPKFISFTGPEPNWQGFGEALFRGVDQHEQGAEIWTSHLDETY